MENSAGDLATLEVLHLEPIFKLFACKASLLMTYSHRFQVSSETTSSISLSITRLRKPGLTDETSWPGFLVHAIIERRLKTLNNASALATSNAGFLASVSSPEGVVRAPTSGRGFKWNSQIGQTRRDQHSRCVPLGRNAMRC